MKATDVQVGGTHYKNFKIQPIEFCMKNGLNACQTNIVKYICRYKHKNGKEDLLKALHYTELWMQFCNEGLRSSMSKGVIPLIKFVEQNQLTENQHYILRATSFGEPSEAMEQIQQLIKNEYPDSDIQETKTEQ
jgi:hypothetical protein